MLSHPEVNTAIMEVDDQDVGCSCMGSLDAVKCNKGVLKRRDNSYKRRS